ncbi:bifunctional diguanylate cyclase/phosphodiesterase [Shewanella carassii]|uniref:putative bifunctional diguanylate cyclase/phosphodiesterase n=1 Tax=Shewanella carassii TaxID=1987584 RepID=UPI001BEE5314|nr:EAL domain-containing protein [Shewanella carassii]BCV66502.1 bifunctional diguanylate cyclase/phosphodiesterase [Shewanella carassii]
MKQHRYQRLLELLTNSVAKQQGDLIKTAELATELLCQYLNVQHASVWSWSKDQHVQFEVARFGSGRPIHSPKPQHLGQLPTYTQQLKQKRYIDANDAGADWRMSELAEIYYSANGIVGALDIAIRINGHIEGVLSLERTVSGVLWSELEIHLASQVADQLALTLATHDAYRKDELLTLFQSAIEQSAQVTMLINLHTEAIEYINSAHEQITGIPKEKMLGASLKQLVFFHQQPKLAEMTLAKVLRGEVATGEVMLNREQGQEYWLSYHASQFITQRGNHYVLVSCEDCTEQHHHQAELERLAWRCSLTGLYNRTHFNRLLDRTYNGRLLLIDLIGFKRFNDTYGHEQGDALLIEVARRLKHFASLYPGCNIARVGSDEFALLLDDRGDLDIDACCHRLYQQLRNPINIGREQVEPKPALAAVNIAEVAELVAPLTCADIALQYAKKKQGTAIQFFNSALLKAFKDDAQIERDLHAAIRGRQFELYYQPLKDLQNCSYIGAEALIRWHHPKRGVLYPGAFIDIAEQSGLINAIGTWVLEAACRQLNLWQHHNINIAMHVNVSARQFFGSNLYEQVWQLLNRYYLKPGTLILEITETELMEDIRYATNLCQELADLGVGLAIDDFGTGYSSMRYLKQFPISKLKIDRSFISDLSISRESREIVSAIIAMAKALNISLTAEGVETAEQERFLTSCMCHQAQGFLYSPALREAEFSAFLQQSQSLCCTD